MNYYVYIITNSLNTVLYTGVTNNLQRRIYEHQNKVINGFSSKYNLRKLIYYDEFKTAKEAIAAEKMIKGWRRSKKIDLIETINPYWNDIAEDLSK